MCRDIFRVYQKNSVWKIYVTVCNLQFEENRRNNIVIWENRFGKPEI